MGIHGGDIYRNEGVVDFSANCNCFGMPEEVRLAAIQGVNCAESYPDPEWEALQKAVSCSITASGGVSSNADLTALRDRGLYAAIVGKAWYAGTVDLAQAVREGGPQ